MPKFFLLPLASALLLVACKPAVPPTPKITNFTECAAAGYPIMESYPRQCRTPGGQTFVEDVVAPPAVDGLIQVSSPQPNAVVGSPLAITGQARGNWYFEASFPIRLYDQEGNMLGEVVAQAQGEWMTEDFVPFSATMDFDLPASGNGTLILEKDNPSGLPQYDAELRIPVTFGSVAMTTVQVYFGRTGVSEDDCQTMVAVERSVPQTPAIGRAALEQLLAGPTTGEQAQGYYTSINPGVAIQSLTIAGGLARVDFTPELEQAVGGSCRVLAIRSQIGQTLKQFPTVSQVTISIDGRTEDILQP